MESALFEIKATFRNVRTVLSFYRDERDATLYVGYVEVDDRLMGVALIRFDDNVTSEEHRHEDLDFDFHVASSVLDDALESEESDDDEESDNADDPLYVAEMTVEFRGEETTLIMREHESEEGVYLGTVEVDDESIEVARYTRDGDSWSIAMPCDDLVCDAGSLFEVLTAGIKAKEEA